MLHLNPREGPAYVIYSVPTFFTAAVKCRWEIRYWGSCTPCDCHLFATSRISLTLMFTHCRYEANRTATATSSAAHPASYPMGSGGSFSGCKAAGAWSWPLASIYSRG